MAKRIDPEKVIRRAVKELEKTILDIRECNGMPPDYLLRSLPESALRHVHKLSALKVDLLQLVIQMKGLT